MVSIKYREGKNMSDTYYGFSENTESSNTMNTESVNTEYSAGSGNDNIPVPPKPKKKKKGVKKFFALIGSAVAFGLVAGLVFWGFASVTVLNQTKQLPTTADGQETGQTAETDAEAAAETSSDAVVSTENYNSVPKVATQCKPSVVAITCTTIEQVRSFWGTQSYETEGAGSGIIVAQNDTELLIATNNHVVSGAESLSVCFNDDKEQVYEAVIKGTDQNNDLAVVAVRLEDISDETMQSIKIATLGDSDTLTVGEQVVAIGNALGYGQSVTTGIISALDREVTIDNVTSSLIQVDAAINPGNSGGALFNMKGELVGINSAKYASEAVEGMGYAIPITKAKDILDELMTRQTRNKVDESQRGYLGITCVDVSADASQMYDLPSGVYVKEVRKGGAADKAGIKTGDIITKFDGLNVSDKESLASNLEYYASGETVEVVLQRSSEGGYKEITVEVTLAPQVLSSDNQGSSQTPSEEEKQGRENDNSDRESSENNLGDLFRFFE